MSRAHISVPTGVAMQFETAGRVAATATSPYHHAALCGGQANVLALRLEQLAGRIRRGELVGPQAVERVLWSCAGFLLSTQTPAEPIPVTARTITDEDVPAHQVSEDEDPDERGL